MQQFIDNWSATLLTPITDTSLALSIEPAKAAMLTGLGGGAFYRLTLVELDGAGVEVDWDVVQVTAVAGGVLTVIRTDTARSWAAGTLIEARLTAAGMAELRDAGGFELGDAVPLALGSASAGASALASREDHQHPAPTPGDIGAATAAQGDLADTAVQPAALTAALAGKVDKEAGKGLSSNDFTSAEKTKLAGLEGSHFKGLHASLVALQAAHPTGAAGDYADVDAGAGVDVVRYLWDVTDAEWIAQAASGGSMTAAEVKTAYESNPDTNAFTDSEKTKLAGVAAGAQVNVPTDLSLGTVTGTTIPLNSSTGADVTLPAATTSTAGLMSGTDKTKLDGIAAGAQVNVPTNLTTTTSATTLTVNSDTGTDATLPAATTSVAGVMTAADKTKLDGIAAGAVAPAQVVAFAGTAKTLALTDINTIVDCTSSSSVTITIPPQSSVTWTADAEMHVRMSGTGTVSIAVGSGVTIPPLAGPIALSGQGAMVTLKRRSSDVWAVVGSVVGGPDVVGPASAVDNEIARFDGTTGKKLKSGLKYQSSQTDTAAGALIIQGGQSLVTSDAVAIGFGAGAGASVTQATSKSTSVTLNKRTGKITMNNAALAAGASVSFSLLSDKIATDDVVYVTSLGGTGSINYRIEPFNLSAGAVSIRVTNISAGSLSDALAFNFVVFKGASA